VPSTENAPVIRATEIISAPSVDLDVAPYNGIFMNNFSDYLLWRANNRGVERENIRANVVAPSRGFFRYF
jgi:hypothetical protein